MTLPLTFSLSSRSDVEELRRRVRSASREIGLPKREAEAVVIAASELATNLVRYAQNGRITIGLTASDRRVGLVIESEDLGPGIPDIALALTDGFSTGGGMGSGLPGVKRLMDEFCIESSPAGTHVRTCKWLPVK